MQSGIRTYFFLGADSRCGYYSLYGSLLSSALCETQYIIKGGHSYGKTFFLEALADLITSSGADVECYRNAQNPELLDGILVPGHRTVFLDGEMPHPVNAQYPGAVEIYIDLGALYDSAALKIKRDEIVALTNAEGIKRKELFRYLSAAGEIRDVISSIVKTEKTVTSIKARAGRNALRELKKTNLQGEVSYRFLRTSSGAESTPDFSPVNARYNRVCVLDNDFGLSCEMLTVIQRRALAQGHTVIVCLDPIEPEKPEHVLIPALSLAYISKTSRAEYNGGVYKHFRLDALPRGSLTPAEKTQIKSDRKLLSELISKAGGVREELRRINHELGEVYAAALDTSAIISLAESYTRRINMR